MASSKDMPPDGAAFFPTIFLRNQFGSTPRWPPKDTDLRGHVAVVTGANTGLGLEACAQLLAHRLSRVILAARSPAKAEAAAGRLRAAYPDATVEVAEVDMSSYASQRALAARLARLERLDIAILNAGVRRLRLHRVAGTGHEETVQVNYLSTALLAILLLPILKQKAAAPGPGRLSIVGSGLALAAKFPQRSAAPLLPAFDDPATFDPLARYNTTKLLGMMFVWRLAECVSADDVIVNLVDPGSVKGTALLRDVPSIAAGVMAVWRAVAARALDVGASTYIDAAVVKGAESHGCYLMSWKISPFAALLYTSEGKEITERLFQETLAELSFAGVDEILKGLKKDGATGLGM